MAPLLFIPSYKFLFQISSSRGYINSPVPFDLIIFNNLIFHYCMKN